MKKFLTSLFLLLPVLAAAQPVQQSGSVTPNFAARWVTPGVIGSAGSATTGLLSSLGTLNNGGPAYCNRSGSSGAYTLFCLKNSATKATISLDSFGGATGALSFSINGTNYDFPYAIGGILGPNTSVSGDYACWNNSSGNLLKDCGQFIPLAAGGLGASQAGATANQIPVYPGSGGAAVPTTITPAIIGSLFANPTQSIDLTTHNGSAATAMRSDAAPALSQSISPTMTGNWTFNPTSGDALTINPATNSFAKAFNSAQTGSGTTTASFDYNAVGISDNAVINSPGITAFGWTVQLFAGTSSKGQRVALRGVANLISGASLTGGDLIGGELTSFANQTNGGTNTGGGAVGTLFGCSCFAVASSGALNYNIVTGGEAAAFIETGASSNIRFAWTIAGNGDLPGANFDAGIGFYNYTSGGAFKNAIELTNILGFSPITTSGCVICTDGSSNTIATGIDLSAYTISGNFLNSVGFSVTGAGAVTGLSYKVGSTAGATCTLTTVSHLTVVNGIVTLCN